MNFPACLTVRAMDQRGQRRDQMDAAVMPDVCRQRGAAPASCAGLQSRQSPAHAGDAGADQGLVADEPEGQADQDRRQGCEPRPLYRFPDGRGRHPTANVPGDIELIAPNYGRSRHRHQRETTDGHAFKGNRREQCVRMPGKTARLTPNDRPGRAECWQQSAPRARLAVTPEKREYSRQFGVHPGNIG